MPKVAKQLDDRTVRALRVPGLHPVGGVGAQGLALQVKASRGDEGQQSRSWVLRYMLAGKRRDMGLGSFPAVGLAEARGRAREARALLVKGVDPVRERQRLRSEELAKQRQSITFREAAMAYMRFGEGREGREGREGGWTNPKHAAQWRNTLEQYAYPVLGPINVEHIQQAHITQVLDPIWWDITVTAERVRSRIAKVLDWAASKGYRDATNPARWKGHLEFTYKVRKRGGGHFAAVPLSDAATVATAIRSKAGMGARALEFLILTAARSGEVRGARWGEIDLESGLWVVPKERMKADKEHRVPLSGAAVALLHGLRRDEGQELVFPSVKGGPLSDMTLTKAMRDIGRSETVHGWRSTFRDWAAELTNYPGDMAEMALAHKIANNVEAAYRRLDMLNKRRRMMDEWAAFLAYPKAARGKVVSLRSGRKAVA